MSRKHFWSAAAAALVVVGALGGAGASAPSPTLVVSQVYGGGGNAGATLKNDFIEIFNRGTTPQSVDGWTVQYASAAGTSWARTNLAGTIPPGGYYLVREAAGSGGTVDLPTADATGSIAMAATSGKVALVASAAALADCTSAVDLVGYGGASCSETAPAPVLTNTTADLRQGAGCVDTDTNSTDFATGAPQPRNSSSDRHFCDAESAPAVVSTAPPDGSPAVAPDSDVSVTFSEPVHLDDGWYAISCGTSGSHDGAVSGGPTTYTIDPASDFAYGETCTVTVSAGAVHDDDQLDPPDTMAADYTFTFTIEPAPIQIHDIQGAAHISPSNGRIVSTTGVVTAVASNGFWAQDPTPDASDATSEGIFVFTSAAPAVSAGDGVKLVGRVTEFRPGSPVNANLTTTELSQPAVVVQSTGNPLPAPVVIGFGGRIPPISVIENDAAGSVETSGVFDPSSDGIDFYESMEGMRVQLNHAVASGPTNSFGETSALGDFGLLAFVRTLRGGIVVRPDDFNPERLIVGDQLTPAPQPLNVRDRYTSPLIGVLDYNFGNFMLQPTQPYTVASGGLQPEVTQAPQRNELAVGTFNVENLDPTDPPSKFARLAGLIVNNLRSPDALAIEEIQDDDGPAPTGSTDAGVTWRMLIAAISAAGGPAYDYRQIDPLFNQDGGEPGGNIRQGFLFRTDRGLSFVDAPGGTAVTPNSVLPGPHLQYSPGRIDPLNAAWTDSRKPLAAEFRWHGRTLFMIANHFISKGGDDPLFGRFQPPRTPSETQRIQQAQVENDFVDSILARDRNADVIVLGDLNNFQFSDALHTLEGGVLHDLIDTLPVFERYSYVFEGNSETLDHTLLSNHLFATGRFEYDVVHVNSEFADQASDHEPQVTRLQLRGGGDGER